MKAVRWLLNVHVTEKLNTRGPGSHLASQQSFAFLGEGTGPRYQTLILALWREGLAGLPAAELPKAVSVTFLGPRKSQAYNRLDCVPALFSCLVLSVPTSVT